MAEKKQEEPANQSKSLTDSDTSDDTEVNPRFKTSLEEREYNTIPGSATATRIALSHSRAQSNPTIQCGPLHQIVKGKKSSTDKAKCCVAPSWLLSLNPYIEFRIWNNSSSLDVLYIQASISISPKYESKSNTTSHCHLLLHDCTNVAV